MEDKKISDFLLRAGFKPKNKGFEYIVYAVKKFSENNFDSRVLGIALYEEIAKVENKTAKTVEKNITCAIESAYLRGDMDYLGEMDLIFDNLRGRPTNSEFIATSAVNLFINH